MMRSASYIRKILYLFFLSFIFVNQSSLHACHSAGLEISYRYIGDSTGVDREYEVLVSVFYTSYFCTGFPSVDASFPVCIKSSCYPQKSVTVSITSGSTQGNPVPGQDECVDRNSPDFMQARVAKYSGTIVLDGNCSDWVFSASSNPSRRMDRIVNYVGDGAIFVKSILNNTRGQNTAPQFYNYPVKSFCTNNFFAWSQAAYEPDNDSIHYRLGQAQNSTLGCGPEVPMPFGPSYTTQSPLNIAPGTNLILHNNGVLEFTTGNIVGAYIVKIIAEEYRRLPGGTIRFLVGTSERDMMINYANPCKASVVNGPAFDIGLTGAYMDSIPTEVRGLIGFDYNIPNADSIPDPNNPGAFNYQWPVIELSCFDSLISLHFDANIQCHTISGDGSEFRIVRPDSSLLPVVNARASCNQALETREIQIKLHQPFFEDGDYYLYIKQGNDGNTLLNSCGFSLPEFYTIVLRVRDCPKPLYVLKNVSVLENNHPLLQWQMDSFPKKYVRGWHFLRSDDGGNSYQTAGYQYNSTDMEWIDYSIQHTDVNSRFIPYQIQMMAGDLYFHESNAVRSIFLEKDEVDFGVWRLFWNPYDAWKDPEYHLMRWDIDPDIWDFENIAESPTFDTSFQYVLPKEAGSYALRIDAHDTNTAVIPYLSMSNYLYFDIPEPEEEEEEEIEPLHVPNVFTPNNDGINDTYEISGLNAYRQAYLIITNRWGNKVFEHENYQNSQPWGGADQKSGAALPEGTYFYILRLYGGPNGDDVKTGQLSIFR